MRQRWLHCCAAELLEFGVAHLADEGPCGARFLFPRTAWAEAAKNQGVVERAALQTRDDSRLNTPETTHLDLPNSAMAL